MVRRPNNNHIGLAMVHTRENGHTIRNAKYAFITKLIIKFYSAFAIHKAIGKQASIRKILLTGKFGIFSQTLTQLVAQIQDDENNYSDGKITNNGNKNHGPRIIKKKIS